MSCHPVLAQALGQNSLGRFTAVLLDELRALSGRPWEIDGPITKHTLAKLLRPFEICPRMLRSKLSARYLWPQPADDQMPPDEVYTLPGGIQMPFTVVNRYPQKPPRSFNQFRSERWPVVLSDDEKVQVAVARFYEIYAAAVPEQEKKQNDAAQDREEVCSAVS